MLLKTLDRYLIKKYLSTFFFTLLICTMISVAIDFSDKVQSFIEKPCTWKEIGGYYLGFMLYMSGLLMPLYALIAVVFFTSRLAFNSEILSILNAGVSFPRLLRPYLLAGGVVSLLHLGFNHFLIPTMNKTRLAFERKYVWTDSEKTRTNNVHLLVAPDLKVFVRGYNKTSNSASGLKLERFAHSKVQSILEAESATYQIHPGKWVLNNYSIRNFDGQNETYKRFTTPLDTFINLKPEDFIWFHNQNEEMTTPELQEVIARDRSRGLSNTKSFETEFHRRTADALTIMILTVIGLSVAGRKVRGGMSLHLVVGIGIGALFILLSKFAVSFATSGSVPIAFGMWIPNLVFAIIAIWLVGRAQK